MKILIAEDNLALQKSVGLLLNCWGFDFDVADNGQEAVERVRQKDGLYDLCLMDIDMPIMSGYEAAQAIRREVRYFPIMAMTAQWGVEALYDSAGMDDYVEKPCDPDRLLDKINELTVKSLKLSIKNNEICFTKEMPMDQQHAKELRQLKEQGLIKMRLDGPAEREIIAHKNTPNKISYDFIVKKQLLSEVLNRDPERPTLCDLYRGNKNCIIETFLDEENYAERLKTDDELMEKQTEKILKEEEE